MVSSEIKVRQRFLLPKLYEPKIRYYYSVSGKIYHSNKFSPEGNPLDIQEEYAQRIWQKYRPGKSVVVYHNPDKPHDAALDLGERLETSAIVAVGIAICAGLAVIVLMMVFVLGIFD